MATTSSSTLTARTATTPMIRPSSTANPSVFRAASRASGDLANYTTSLNCDGGSDFTYNEGDTSGSITLAADDSVTCTFTNTFVEILPPPPGDGLITCDLGAVTPLVRAEGIAELLGDIIIVCHTIPAGAVVDPDGYIEVNVTASLNVSITNNRDYNGGFQDDTTDAVLVINENNCGARPIGARGWTLSA